MAAKMRHPDKKVSETLLEFAAPLFEDMPTETPEKHAGIALDLAMTVSNAVVFADVLHRRNHLQEVRRLVSGQPGIREVVERMVERKRALFAGDERVIIDFKVTAMEGGFNVNATATDPFTIPREPDAC